MRDETFMRLMRLLPTSALSTAVGMATRAPAPRGLHHAAIRAFARRYRVNLDEAALRVDEFPNFAQFFTRALKPGIRPIDPAADAVVSPVDGAVSQIGYALDGACLQAKGVTYPVERLLGDAGAAAPFRGGAFATLYLSPRDYHRIHSPLDGHITGYGYIPGQFWPVNPASVNGLPSLFCLNERLVTYLETAAGKVAVVKVGATNVARIRASYDDLLTHRGAPGKVHRYDTPIPVKKGDELGVFEMGSTVILLFETGRVRWEASLGPESVVRMGARIGVLGTPAVS
jgi:phosphatidylserine decarboxylase